MFDDYFLQVDFDVEELNQQVKSDMIAQFIQKKIVEQDQQAGYNMEYVNYAYRSIVADKFEDIVHQKFDVDELISPVKTWIYVQNKEHYVDNWHDHTRTSSVNAVFYIDPPKNGGHLELIYWDQIYKIQPESKKLYIFPSWMCHRPTIQTEDNWRISVNVEYFCRNRPIVKSTGVMW